MAQLDVPALVAQDGVVVAGDPVDPAAVRAWLADDPRMIVVLSQPQPDVEVLDPDRVVFVADPGRDAIVRVLRAQQLRLAAMQANRDRMELDLRHAQKMDAVGQLASGIAHEINTPIQFIGDSVYFLEGAFEDLSAALRVAREQPQDRGALEEKLDEIDLAYIEDEVPRAFHRTRGGCERVSTIVRAMRNFARADQLERAPADLETALRSTVVVATNRIKMHADVELDLQPLPAVVCRIGDLNQVFLNLLVNAADAIQDADRGRGAIRVASRDLGEGWVEVRITDTGIGMPPAVQERIFEPFFTTKEVGRGTGQGLAISHAIVVERHRGELLVESEVGLGTTFVIRLPVGREGNDA